MANPSEPSAGRYGVGQPVSRTEDPVLLRGEGRYTDDLNEPGQAYAWMVRSPHAHGILKNISVRKMPGVLAVYTAKDLEAYGPHKCLLDFKNRDGSPMKRPIRRSLAHDKVRFVGDPVACVVAQTADAGEGRGGGGRARHRAAAGGGACKRSGEARRAAALRGCAGECRGGLSLRRAGESRRGFQESGSHYPAQFAKHPGGRRGDGASRRPVRLRQEHRALDAHRAGPGRVRHAQPARRHPRRAAGQGAHVHLARRRLVRHEGIDLPRVRVPRARGARARPPGEVDRRALGELRLRPARARPRDDRRARARCRRPLPRRARHRLRQRRRVPRHRGAAAAVDERGAKRLQRLPHAAPRGVDQGDVHQHLAGERLPGRRAARGELLHGAPHRPGGRRDGHRPPRASPAQPCAARGDSVQGGLGDDLRQRRLRYRVRKSRKSSGPRGVRGPEEGKQRTREAARARNRQLPGSHRAAQQGDGRDPLRSRRRK